MIRPGRHCVLRPWSAVALTIAAAGLGCHRTPPETSEQTLESRFVSRPPSPASLDADLSWTIAAAPTTIGAASEDSVRLTITVTNRGARTVDPRHADLEIVVDGIESNELSEAFGNGGLQHGGPWFALAPGATAETARDFLPREIARSPGDHVIAVARGDRLAASTVLHLRR